MISCLFSSSLNGCIELLVATASFLGIKSERRPCAADLHTWHSTMQTMTNNQWMGVHCDTQKAGLPLPSREAQGAVHRRTVALLWERPQGCSRFERMVGGAGRARNSPYVDDRLPLLRELLYMCDPYVEQRLTCCDVPPQPVGHVQNHERHRERRRWARSW